MYLQGLLIDVISTVQETCDDGFSFESAYLRSSPVTRSHGVPLIY